MTESNYIILAAVGPVQDFIASARRTRDLAFSSIIISDLAKAVARSFKANGAELIMPSPYLDKAKKNNPLEPGQKFMIANKVLAKYQGDNPEEILEKAKLELKKTWKEIAGKALDNAKTKSSGKPWKVIEDRFNEQVDSIIEFYGVWVKLENKSYKNVRERAESLLSGVKTLRDYNNFSGQAGVPKSSLDGARETVIKHPENKKNRKYGIQIQVHEQLCAIGLIKRFGGMSDNLHFPSTHHMAALPWMQKVASLCKKSNNTKLIKKINEFKELHTIETTYEKLDNFWNRTSGANFFLSRIDDMANNEHDEDIEKHKKYLKEIFKFHDVGEPSPYYALLLGDGDHMGKIIDTICSSDSQNNHELHQQLSLNLSIFSEKAEKIVNEHDGSIIYAGGDDVMAILPLPEAMSCAREIRNEFIKVISETIKENDIKSSIKPGFSIGLVIGHALSPLQGTIDMARKAERLAKNESGRDSLAMIINRRSGAPVETWFKWEDKNLYELFEKFVAWFNKGVLPAGLPYELNKIRGEFDSLKSLNGFETKQFKSIVMNEIIRTITHKEGNKSLTKEDRNELNKKFEDYFNTLFDSYLPKENNDSHSIITLNNALAKTIDFTTVAVQLSQGRS